jgi:hypothetical protein
MKFRTRMWLVLVAGLVGQGIMLAPQVIHSFVMERRAAAWRMEAEITFGRSATTADVVDWLSIRGETVFGPALYYDESLEFGEGARYVLAERALADGTWAWNPATAHLSFYFDRSGALRRIESNVRPYRPVVGRWSEPIWIVVFSPVVPLVAVLVVVCLVLRRRIRARSNRCVECGYDLRGALGDGCPECGWQRTSALSRDAETLSRAASECRAGPKPLE